MVLVLMEQAVRRGCFLKDLYFAFLPLLSELKRVSKMGHFYPRLGSAGTGLICLDNDTS